MKRLSAALRAFLYRLGGVAPRRRESAGRDQGTLAVLAIMKNEAMALDEWMSHYFAVGAHRIVLIDNGSTDGTLAKARAWVERGGVDLISRPERHRQTLHYWDAFQRFIQGRYDWLLIADLDEFWFCPDGKPIPAKLMEDHFSALDVIYANWVLFGSSGHRNQPDSLRTQFLHRSPHLQSHRHTKFICRTRVLTGPERLRVHKLVGACSSRTVTDNENFRLFHYAIQSEEFFTKVKMVRGSAAKASNDHVRDMDYFRHYDSVCTVVDRTLADLVEQDRLGKG